jgi:predicted HNH restriction endonuclease
MSWLSRLLGMDAIVEAKDLEITNLYTQLHNYQQMLELKDHEIQRLTNLILMEHGVIVRERFEGEIKSGSPKAINKRPNWRAVQKDFEKADMSVAKSQVDDIKEYWENKSVNEGNTQ